MEESKRQKQVAGLLQEEMNHIFLRMGLNQFQGGMVSISKVVVTPDLLEARIYTSFFNVPNKQLALEHVNDKHHDIKRQLVQSLGKQLRRIPVLSFYSDDTLDYVYKMEEVFKNLDKPQND
jgi:ribosome-binding factor A